ncbi:DUF6445 family protein [Pelomonas aquatica]|jgi:hypothetical protein|nr:DUF6445 family protein [Pelomonas aquatica]MCY4754521.1 DUF6445 family protein [Pelomonas aquatica]
MMNPPHPSPAPKLNRLVYREPQLGRDYWVLDDALPDPMAVRERALAAEGWVLGAPHRAESWPGMRLQPGLTEDELAPLERWMLKQTGTRKVYAPQVGVADRINHNCVQLVGLGEGRVKPHTDSRALCTYAAVLYLSPDIPAHAGTSFFRVVHPDGQPGGNCVPSRFANLVEAFGTRFVPNGLFVPDVAVDARFNRLLLYRADLIHSASAYVGEAPAERRMTAVFFWMAR